METIYAIIIALSVFVYGGIVVYLIKHYERSDNEHGYRLFTLISTIEVGLIMYLLQTAGVLK